MQIKIQKQNLMYNIDFKVSGQILSISVGYNDTIQTLICRMKNLKPFQKYMNDQLQQKLVINLKKILISSTIQQKIRIQIEQLVKKSKINKNIQNNIEYKNLKHRNYYRNNLQQNFINNSFLQAKMMSETKVRRKYNLQQSICQNLEKDSIQSKLHYNYKPIQNQKIFHTLQNANVKLNNYFKHKNPSFNQFNCQTNFKKSEINPQDDPKWSQTRELTRNHKREFQSLANANFLQSFLLKYDQYLQKSHESQNLIHSPRKYPFKSQNCNSKNEQYNPVPKLNELIQKSRSLSKIAQRNNCNSSLRERNINIQHNFDQNKHRIGKIKHGQPVLLENRQPQIKIKQAIPQRWQKNQNSEKLNQSSSRLALITRFHQESVIPEQHKRGKISNNWRENSFNQIKQKNSNNQQNKKTYSYL